MAGSPDSPGATNVSDTGALWTFLTALSAVSDELERARLTATGLPSLLSCDVSGVALLRESDSTWQLTLQKDGHQLDSLVGNRVKTDLEGLARESFGRSGPLIVTTGGSETNTQIPPAIAKLGVQCLAVVPLMTLHHRLGLLFAGRRGGHTFSQPEESALLTLAEHLATGIENLRLYQTLQQHSRDLESLVAERTEKLRTAEERRRMLLEINNAIIANLDKRSLFEAVSKTLAKTLSFDRASLTLLDRETDTLRVYALTDPLPSDPTVSAGAEFPRRGSHLASVFDHKQPLIRRDLEAEHRVGLEDRLHHDGLRSYVAAPLMRHERVFGTLNIGSRAPDRYSEDDAALLAEVAQQVALAVENTLAHEEIAALKTRVEQENLYLQEEIQIDPADGCP